MICLHQGDAVNLRETPGTSGRLGMSALITGACIPPCEITVYGGGVLMSAVFVRGCVCS